MKFLGVIASFVVLLCGIHVLEFDTSVTFMVCGVVLEVGSAASVAWSWFLCSLDLSDY